MRKYLVKLAEVLSRFLAKSYYVTQFSRMVVKVYDNDCNADMDKNGESKVQRLISSSSDAGSVFVDVGANVGDWSAALVRSGAKGRIVAVDPLGGNLSIVREKLTGLDYSNFELCECALSDTNGHVDFFINKDRTLSGHDSLYDMRSIGYNETVSHIEVRSKTLDDLATQLNVAKITFLKIDVEGNELSVLKGAKSLLLRRAIEFIQIEFGHAARAARVYLHDIVNYLNQYEYDLFVIKPGGLLPLEFTPFTENRYSYINFLIAKRDSLGKLAGHILKR